MAKIRLIIPIVEKYSEESEYYSKECLDIESRIALIKKAITQELTPDVLITGNNFFALKKNVYISIKEFLEEKIITKLNEMDKKVPIILGLDFFGGNIRQNPYASGIDSVVCVLDPEDSQYKYRSHIWEIWEGDPNNINLFSFLEQEEKRYIELKELKWGIFSCGDIFKETHEFKLNKADIFVDLAHMNFARSINRIKNRTIKKCFNYCKTILISQQISIEEFEKYKKLYFDLNQNGECEKYKFIFIMNNNEVETGENKVSVLEENVFLVDFEFQPSNLSIKS